MKPVGRACGRKGMGEGELEDRGGSGQCAEANVRGVDSHRSCKPFCRRYRSEAKRPSPRIDTSQGPVRNLGLFPPTN